MIRLKCPKCEVVLKVREVPPSGKIKCPKCVTVLKVASPKPAVQAARSAPKHGVESPGAQPSGAQPSGTHPPSGHPLNAQSLKGQSPGAKEKTVRQSFASTAALPGDLPSVAQQSIPQQSIPQQGDPFAETGAGFDFADLPSGGGSSEGFPSGSFPAAAAPLGSGTFPQGQPAHAGTPGAQRPNNLTPGTPPDGNKAKSKIDGGGRRWVPFVVAGGVVFGLIFAFVAAVMVFVVTPISKSVSSIAEDVANVPPDFQRVRVSGVSALMPEGFENESYPNSMECRAFTTEQGTVFMLASTPANNQPMEPEKLRRRVDRLLVAGVILTGPCQRNGYHGHKGILDQSNFVPKMNVEIYQDEGRIIVIGVSAEGGGGANYVVGQESEPEKQKIFYDSFEIGPAPSTSMW